MSDLYNDIEIVDDFAPQANPHEDRITAILQKRSQPAPEMVSPDEMDNYGIANIASREGPQAFLQTIEKLKNQRTQDYYAQQDRELGGAQTLYNMFEEKRARGDKQAQALFDKISLFTGDDPEGMAMFVEQLHNDPDKIDPSNSFQVMTKLAGIAKKSGYVSPEAQLKKLTLQKTRQELNGGGVKPQSPVGKLAADFKAGLIDEETYKSAVGKSTGSGSAKPMPSAALKLQNEALDIIGTSSGMNQRLQTKIDQLKNKKLKLGPFENVWSAGKNLAGKSDENSRNFASFKADLEKLRNDSLRLNKGVQTEGDAQRAWNEILSNINDEELVAQRLQEVQEINARAAELQKLNVDNIRANYGHDPIDYSGYEESYSEPAEDDSDLADYMTPEERALFDQ